MTCGEPQNERCINSAKQQCGFDIDTYLIQNKKNIEAHKELYETINSEKGYDYFVKLDGDMEFSSENSLKLILSNMKDGIDHLTIPVFDYMTMDDMLGLHVFSGRTMVILGDLDELFVDKVVYLFPGKKIKLTEGSKLVLHCKNPSKTQASAFGIHRAMKFIQRNRFIPVMGATRYHYNTLRKVFDYWVRTNSEIHYTVLVAALNVIRKTEFVTMMSKTNCGTDGLSHYSEDDVRNFFSRNSFVAAIHTFGILRFNLSLITYIYSKIFRLLFER